MRFTGYKKKKQTQIKNDIKKPHIFPLYIAENISFHSALKIS